MSTNEKIKITFFDLQKKDRALLLALFWSLPIVGVGANLVKHLSGQLVPPQYFVGPVVLAIGLTLIKKWPAFLFRVFRFAPFYLLFVVGLLASRSAQTWVTSDYVTVVIWVFFALLAIKPSLAWHRLAKGANA